MAVGVLGLLRTSGSDLIGSEPPLSVFRYGAGKRGLVASGAVELDGALALTHNAAETDQVANHAAPEASFCGRESKRQDVITWANGAGRSAGALLRPDLCVHYELIALALPLVHLRYLFRRFLVDYPTPLAGATPPTFLYQLYHTNDKYANDWTVSTVQ